MRKILAKPSYITHIALTGIVIVNDGSVSGMRNLTQDVLNKYVSNK